MLVFANYQSQSRKDFIQWRAHLGTAASFFALTKVQRLVVVVVITIIIIIIRQEDLEADIQDRKNGII